MFTGKGLDSEEEMLRRTDSAAATKQLVCFLLALISQLPLPGIRLSPYIHKPSLTWAPSWSSVHERALGPCPALQGGGGEAEFPHRQPSSGVLRGKGRGESGRSSSNLLGLDLKFMAEPNITCFLRSSKNLPHHHPEQTSPLSAIIWTLSPFYGESSFLALMEHVTLCVQGE